MLNIGAKSKEQQNRAKWPGIDTYDEADLEPVYGIQMALVSIAGQCTSDFWIGHMVPDHAWHNHSGVLPYACMPLLLRQCSL